MAIFFSGNHLVQYQRTNERLKLDNNGSGRKGGGPVPERGRMLEATGIREKLFLSALGLATPPFVGYISRGDMPEHYPFSSHATNIKHIVPSSPRTYPARRPFSCSPRKGRVENQSRSSECPRPHPTSFSPRPGKAPCADNPPHSPSGQRRRFRAHSSNDAGLTLP